MPLFSRRPADAAPPLPLPYEPRSPEGLAARWVRWVAAAGPVRNPLEDDTGENAGHNQPDDVWFLAGSYGRKPMVRRCTVPAGRDLFLPAFNFWAAGGPEELPPFDDAFGHAFGEITLDGRDLGTAEVFTPEPFAVAGARLNGVTQTRKEIPMRVWGLWQRVAAPTVGHHVLHAVGGDGRGFVVDVTYHLGVAAALPDYPA